MTPPPWTQQVEALIAQIQLRNQDAFQTLYQLTSGKLYGLVLKIIPEPDTAADILQESYTRVWQHAHRYRADLGGAWPWICQIVRNCAIDRIRQQQRRPEFNSADPSADLVTDDSGLWQQHYDLSRCLQQIRREPRKAIVSAYLYGLSHSELAQQMQTPLGTLKSWIRRGLKELHQCLEA